MDVNDYAERLLALYQEQLSRTEDSYLRAHCSTRGGLIRQVQAARYYMPFVKGRILDWGL